MMSATSPTETFFKDLVLVDVVARSVFYNNSAFDGNNPTINADDDLARASDKSALMPGGTATFANYTSYSRGINGLMIDVAGLPSTLIDAGDFQFRIGNVNNPASWTTAPAPTAISVRAGAGISGSSRIEVVWADGAIKNEWLEVTLKATPHTGLTQNDTFYFGNAIGESGNSAANAIVDASDVAGAQNNPRSAGNPAPVTFAYDYNRDGLVDATDQSIASSNTTTASTALKLIQPPTITQTPLPQRLQTSLFNWGDDGVPVITIPAIVSLDNGVVLAFAEMRADRQDKYAYGILMRRSTDDGVTWSAPQVVYSVAPRTGLLVAQATPVVDKITGAVMLLMSSGTINATTELPEYSDVLITRSTDGGVTWGAVQNITSQVKVTASNNPGPPGVWPNDPWGWIIVGSGHGIQLEHGPNAGRLLVAGDHRLTADTTGESWSHVIYSDDHGVTWHLGGGLVGDSNAAHPNDLTNEATLVELSDGSIYMSSRINDNNVHNRGESISTDGGLTFSTVSLAPDLQTYQVHGSLLRLNDNVLLFSSPASTNSSDTTRHEMTIWLSYDDGKSWSKKKVIFFGYAGYSDMTVVGPDTILLTFARGWTGGLLPGDSNSNAPEFYQEVGLVRVNLRFLESDEPYEFTWNFNDQPIGSTASYSGSSIQDYGFWDQRAMARASSVSSAGLYVAGPGNDSALQLSGSPGSNGVVLSQAYNTALQVGPNDSFTVQIEMKTSDTDGVIIGTRPTIRNWTLQVVGGKLQFSLYDTQNTCVITSTATIADGQWHHIAAVRDAVNRQLHIYIDGVEAATPVVDTATFVRNDGSFDPIDPVYMGVYNSLLSTSKLALTVDTLKFTRAVLDPSAFFSVGQAVPAPPAPPEYLPNAPTSIDGLQFWLPAYDPTRFYSDQGLYSQPLPLVPFDGMSTRSALEASANELRVQTTNPNRQILYAKDPLIGSYWSFSAKPQAAYGSELWVRNMGGSKTNTNFDFIQNTGVFTLSTFVMVGDTTQNNMTIFDTNEGNASKPGFSLMVQQDGRLYLSISGGTTDTVRYNTNGPTGTTLNRYQWYQVAIVGNGPGQPIQFYVTPASASAVTAFNSTTSLAGANGTYTTDFNHELFIGGRSNKASSGAAPFNGGLVNEAIFNRALSAAEIQQLFNFGKGLASSGPAWQNQTEPLDVDNNGAINARDVAYVVSALLLHPNGALPTGSPPPFVDVNGDNALTANDALRVINYVLLHSTPAAAPTSLAAAPAFAAATTTDTASIDGSTDTQSAASAPLAAPAVTIETVADDSAAASPASAITLSQADSQTAPRVLQAQAILAPTPNDASIVDSSGPQVAPGAATASASSPACDAYFERFARLDEQADADEDPAAALFETPRAPRANRARATA